MHDRFIKLNKIETMLLKKMSDIGKQGQFSQKINTMQSEISPFKLQISFLNKLLNPS